MGKVPALKDGRRDVGGSRRDLRLCPPSAIPRRNWRRRWAIPLRAKYLYWLFFGPSCIEPAMVQIATKIEMNPVSAGWGEATRVFDVLGRRPGEGAVDPRRHILGR